MEQVEVAGARPVERLSPTLAAILELKKLQGYEHLQSTLVTGALQGAIGGAFTKKLTPDEFLKAMQEPEKPIDSWHDLLGEALGVRSFSGLQILDHLERARKAAMIVGRTDFYFITPKYEQGIRKFEEEDGPLPPEPDPRATAPGYNPAIAFEAFEKTGHLLSETFRLDTDAAIPDRIIKACHGFHDLNDASPTNPWSAIRHGKAICSVFEDYIGFEQFTAPVSRQPDVQNLKTVEAIMRSTNADLEQAMPAALVAEAEAGLGGQLREYKNALNGYIRPLIP